MKSVALVIAVCLAVSLAAPATYAQTADDYIIKTDTNVAPANASTERMRVTDTGRVGIGHTNPPSLLTVGEAPTTPFITTTKLWVGNNAANPGDVAGSGGVLGLFAGGGLFVINHLNGSDVAAFMFRGADSANSKSRILFLGDDSVRNSSITSIVDVQASSGHLAFETAPSSAGVVERMRITSAGRVAIGRTTADAMLHVAGDVVVDGNIGAKYQDVAEWVDSTADVPAGTVVVLSTRRTNEVSPSAVAYDTRVAGVVSDLPGLILGESGPNREKVATMGRVRVRVDATSAPITIGDLLVTSDVSGVAMRSEPLIIQGRQIHQPGTIIGKALEPLESGKGEILVLLSLQ